jgi:hypothetical protein
MRVATLACHSVDIPAKDGGYTMPRGRALGAFRSTVVKVVTADAGSSSSATIRTRMPSACAPWLTPYRPAPGS